METKAKERNIGFEVMRIVSMLLIILLHSIDHSGAYENLAAGSALYYIEHFFYAAVQVCVNCFVLISGYFLVTSEFKPKKLISLWFEVVFYSAAIKIILMLLGEMSFRLLLLRPALCRYSPEDIGLSLSTLACICCRRFSILQSMQ